MVLRHYVCGRHREAVLSRGCTKTCATRRGVNTWHDIHHGSCLRQWHLPSHMPWTNLHRIHCCTWRTREQGSAGTRDSGPSFFLNQYVYMYIEICVDYIMHLLQNLLHIYIYMFISIYLYSCEGVCHYCLYQPVFIMNQVFFWCKWHCFIRTDFRSEDSNLVFSNSKGSPNSSQNAVPSYSELLIIQDPFRIPTFVRSFFFDSLRQDILLTKATEMSSLHPRNDFVALCCLTLSFLPTNWIVFFVF